MICTGCGVEKSKAEFLPKGRRCRTCWRKYQNEYQAKHRPHINAQSTARRNANLEQRRVYEREWRAKHPAPNRHAHHRRRYGLEPEAYQALFDAQQGRCAICQGEFVSGGGRHSDRRRKACVDHDHASGKTRALLCDWCNRGMGLYRDDPARLRAAADYIERHRVMLVPSKKEA